MAALPAHRKITADEYLALEEVASERHEFVAGEVFAMAGATTDHNAIAGKLYATLLAHLEGRPCRVYMSDVKLRVDAADAFFYADVFVTCDPRDLADRLVQRHAVLVVEVLSDATAEYDRDEKFADYARLPSLAEYVLVDSRHRQVDVFRRDPGGAFRFLRLSSADELELSSVGLRVAVNALYANTDVPERRSPRSAT